MKKIDLGQTIAILANVGVIAGIAFLAFELRQNTQAVELASAQTYLTGGSELDLRIATDTDLARTLNLSALWRNCSWNAGTTPS
jgi:hypothetical protein